MTPQELINLLVGGGFAVLGWFARVMYAAVKLLETDLGKLREELPKTYLSRHDYREDIFEIKSILNRIDTKLDRKVDKP